MTTPGDRRQQGRTSQRQRAAQVLISQHGQSALAGRLIDLSEWGLGVETAEPLGVGTDVHVSGQFFSAASALGPKRRARVVHCRSVEEGVYRSGLAFDSTQQAQSDARHMPLEELSSFIDHYEILQLSPNADPEAIHRVYRLLAQRYHPDNRDSGDEQVFRRVLQAFHVLSDPEKRAAYDTQYQAGRALRWKVFDQRRALHGAEAERTIRGSILKILRAQRLEQPNHPGVNVRDLEQLLGCPREHLEFSLWYLKAKGLVTAGDHGRYTITAEGVDTLEQMPLTSAPLSRALPSPEART